MFYYSFPQVSMETKLIDALGLFVARRVSALPVIDDDNHVVDIYAKFDVIVSGLFELKLQINLS